MPASREGDASAGFVPPFPPPRRSTSEVRHWNNSLTPLFMHCSTPTEQTFIAIVFFCLSDFDNYLDPRIINISLEQGKAVSAQIPRPRASIRIPGAKALDPTGFITQSIAAPSFPRISYHACHMHVGVQQNQLTFPFCRDELPGSQAYKAT